MPLIPVAELRPRHTNGLAVHGMRWLDADAGGAALHDGLDAPPSRELPAGHGLTVGFDAAGTAALVDFWRVPLNGAPPAEVPQLGLAAGPGGGFTPTALAWAPDGAELVAAAAAAPLLLPGAPAVDGWRLAVLDPLTGDPRAVRDGAGDDAPRHVACADHTVLVATSHHLRCFDRALAPADPVADSAGVRAVAAGGRTGAAVDGDGRMIIVALGSGAATSRVRAHEHGATAVAVAPGGGWIVTASEAGEIRAWSAAGEPLGAADVPAPVEALAAGDDLLIAAWVEGATRRATAFRLDG